MVYDKFYSLQEQFWGWKCQICGEIVDPVILESRQLIGIVLIVLGVVVLAY
jgi:hypothetical protein